MVVPDAIEPFEGWRAWRVRNGVLIGMHFSTVWTPGERMEATCGWGLGHEVPAAGCTCGVHATSTREQLGLNYLFHVPDVYGSVALWGRVMKHGSGYRAEFGYPTKLFVRDENHVEALEMYGVLVVVEGRGAA